MMASLSVVLSVASLTIFASVVMALIGWPIARRARGYTDGLEQVLLSLLCGQAFLFVVQAVVYIAVLPEIVVAIIGAGLLVAAFAVFLVDWHAKRALPLWEYTTPLLVWIGLTISALACTSLVVVQGVPGEAFDWWEHYRRAEIFLLQLSADTTLGTWTPAPNVALTWTLASRGPLFNALAAALMELTGKSSYWAFSVFATLLNAQAVLPLALLLRRFARQSTPVALTSAALVLFCMPILNWNLTYTWTKLAAANWILASLALSLEGIHRTESRLIGWGIVAMALGFLTHFLVFLYGMLLLPCLVYYLATHKGSFRPVLLGTLAGTLLVGGWMLFLIDHFGLRNTVYANSTLGYGPGAELTSEVSPDGVAGRLRLMALNFAASLLPSPARHSDLFRGTRLEARPDEVVTVLYNGQRMAHPGQYPTNPMLIISRLEGAIGWTGIVLLFLSVALEIQADARGRFGPSMGFWCYVVLVGVPVNLWAAPWYAAHGVLNLNFHPYLCLAAVWVMARLGALPVWAQVVAAGTWLIECAIRIAAIVSYQTAKLPLAQSALGVSPLREFTTDGDYLKNYRLKIAEKVVMLRDLVPTGSHVVSLFSTLVLLGVVCLVLAWTLARRRMPIPVSSAGAPKRADSFGQ